MALFRDDTGKTEKPTGKRLFEARNRGQVALSREFVMAGSLLVVILALRKIGPSILDSFVEVLRHGMRMQYRALDRGIPGFLDELMHVTMLILPPASLLIVIGVVATAVFGYAQIGLQFTPQAMGFRFERLNPLAGFSRLFSPASAMRGGAALAKVIVLGGVLAAILQDRWQELAHLHRSTNLPMSLGIIADLALTLLFWVAVPVFTLSLADVAWQRFDFLRGMMMSRQEVDDEHKQAEGDPMVKRRLREARMELMRHRMMEAVPKADVVLTNPTHFSVALRYDRNRNRAPEVVAKGVDELALRIRELAREHRVPLLEDPPLARALFRAVKVGQEIPTKFYKAVAAVLGHVYRLRGKVA